MTTVGRSLCNSSQISSLGTAETNVWYYDGIRVYSQIAQYTGDPSWYDCARYVKQVYLPYVQSVNGKVGGWRVFSEGLKKDFQRTGDAASKSAALALATNSPFAPQGGGASFDLSRETAYVLEAYIDALELGASAPQLSTAVNYALGHIQQWQTNAGFVKPFMVGLTFEALIRYHERTGDSRVLPAVKGMADWMWTNLWRGSDFPYIWCRDRSTSSECDSPDNANAVNLNLLIAPAYGWLYAMTGDAKYQQQGDAMFKSGVEGAWLGNGKLFNQNYRWSMRYVAWRGGK